MSCWGWLKDETQTNKAIYGYDYIFHVYKTSNKCFKKVYINNHKKIRKNKTVQWCIYSTFSCTVEMNSYILTLLGRRLVENSVRLGLSAASLFYLFGWDNTLAERKLQN